ncbi:TIGR02453 family protein [Yoonia tamlensis]|uniref:TIGR02453 family protein n=1 Tax=Yoonia tamlensis TaxID=390270 RepID=A0A1I6FXV5_9RHOB|nr:TIGR02453 family protein [Yoonia tamlensis]SFR34730.1 TIGR02453 family protein [Yoonia tamlensis]
MQSIAALISQAQAFYAQLADNNTRDWWTQNRATYDDRLKPGALELLDELTAPLSDLAGAPVTPKLFRPHRDVRFSKDKTPYNTHLHMMWQIQTDAPQNPVFFFGIGVDYVSAGAGLMGFEKPMQTNWRTMLDLDGDRMLAILDGLEATGFSFREPALKRVPAPYDQDHPAARFMRMKGAVASREVPHDAPLLPIFTALWPLNALLLSIAEA